MYTILMGPTAWRAPETFESHSRAGSGAQIVSAASDVFMLGCCFVEVLTKCERMPFDWLPSDDVFVYRKHESTRNIGPTQVL